MGGDWLERHNGWIWNEALLDAFLGWLFIPGMKCKVSTWEDKSIRKAKWNVFVDLGGGMRKPLMLCGAEVGEYSWQLSVDSEENKPKRWMVWKFTDRKHRVIKIYLFFDTATTNGWWGNLEVFGQRSGAKALNFVRLLYIIRLYLSPIYRRRRGIEYNFMLCILALSCFFSGANQVRWWRLEYLMSFFPVAGLAYWFFWGTRKSNVPIVGWLQKVWQKKTTAGWIVRKPTKRPCKPCTSTSSVAVRLNEMARKGEDFCLPMVVLRSCP